MANPKNNSKNLIGSSKDPDLRERFTVLAADLGIANPEAWVSANVLAIVSVDIDAEANTVAHNYGYADNVRSEKVAQTKKAYEDAVAADGPGKNPGAVSDDHIRAALTKVKNAQSTVRPA